MMPPVRFVQLRTRLFAGLLLALLALLATHLFVKPPGELHKGQRYHAAAMVQQAEQSILAQKQRLGVVVDPHLDPAETGLIGPRYTLLTTEESTLKVKRTASNPNMAAIVVKLLHKAHVRQNDVVAVCCTASLPGLNLAALSAIQSMNAQATVIASLGASMYGATDPQFTWLDMQTLLQQQKLLSFNCIAATPGGLADSARGLPVETIELMRTIAKRNHMPFFIPNSVDDGVEYRLRLLSEAEHGLPKAMVFVGGGVAGYGTHRNRVIAEGPYLKTSLAAKMDPQGLIYRMLKAGVPVIVLHNVEKLAADYHLPLDPTDTVAVGEPDALYGVKHASLLPLGIINGVLLLGLGLVLRMGSVVPSELHCQREGKDQPEATRVGGTGTEG